jgi:hypothetical protein
VEWRGFFWFDIVAFRRAKGVSYRLDMRGRIVDGSVEWNGIGFGGRGANESVAFYRTAVGRELFLEFDRAVAKTVTHC